MRLLTMPSEIVPHDLLGVIPAGLPYSIWQLVEHIRITQWDILGFSRNPDHVSPEWPKGYWPKEKAPAIMPGTGKDRWNGSPPIGRHLS